MKITKNERKSTKKFILSDSYELSLKNLKLKNENMAILHNHYKKVGDSKSNNLSYILPYTPFFLLANFLGK